jgi:hypothetical protein
VHDKIRISATSYVTTAIKEAGHIFQQQVPCMLLGIYIPQTGTVILESVIANGELLSPIEIDLNEWEEFNQVLRHEVLLLEF